MEAQRPRRQLDAHLLIHRVPADVDYPRSRSSSSLASPLTGSSAGWSHPGLREYRSEQGKNWANALRSFAATRETDRPATGQRAFVPSPPLREPDRPSRESLSHHALDPPKQRDRRSRHRTRPRATAARRRPRSPATHLPAVRGRTPATSPAQPTRRGHNTKPRRTGVEATKLSLPE